MSLFCRALQSPGLFGRVSGVIQATAVQVGGQAGPGISINFSTAQDAGLSVGAITVTTNIPGTYVGTVTIGGTDAAKFSLSSTSNVLSGAYQLGVSNLFIGQTNVAAGTYAITLNASP